MADIANEHMKAIRSTYPEDAIPSDQTALDNLGEVSKDDFILSLGEDYKAPESEEEKMFELGMLAFIKYIDRTSSDIKDLAQIIRPDTSSGSISPTIGEHIEKIRKIQRFIRKKTSGDLFISMPDEVIKMFDERLIENGMNSDSILNEMTKGSHNSYISALNILAQRKCLDYLKKYFPQADKSWIDTILATYDMCYHESEFHKKTLFDQMINELISFMLLKDKRLVKDVDKDRDKYLNDTPKYLIELKQKRAQIVEKINAGEKVSEEERILADNMFLKRLYVYRSKDSQNQIAKIQFEIGGSLTSTIAEDLRQSWGELLKMKDPKIRKFATDLYMYALFSDGFGFGMYTFSQFAPLSIMLSTPGYSQAMDNLIGSEIDDDTRARFAFQYGCNHAFDGKVAPRIKGDFVINTSTVQDVAQDKSWVLMKPGFNQLKPGGFYFLTGKNPGLYFLGIDKDTRQQKFTKFPVLGRVTKKNQFFFQYNPYVDARDMKNFESTVLTFMSFPEKS